MVCIRSIAAYVRTEKRHLPCTHVRSKTPIFSFMGGHVRQLLGVRSGCTRASMPIKPRTRRPDELTMLLVDSRLHCFTPQLGNQRPAVLPAWISCPLPAAFSGSPSQGHRRVSHADGYAVFKVQQAKRKQKSRHRTDQPCLRFFWKVMLVGYVTAESQNVQPRRARTNM